MNKTLLWLVILIFSMPLLSGCIEKMKHDQQSQLIENDHPLVGRIWNVKQSGVAKQSEFLAHLVESRYILLGENHDNISHHEHQADIVSALSNAKKAVSVHFEMIDDVQYKRLIQSKPESLNDLMAELSKSDTGWQYERMYKVIFEQVLQADYAYLPANLSYEGIRNIIKEGEEKVPGDIKKMLADVPLSLGMTQDLEQEVIDGHCNALPASMVAPMMLAQKVRDAHMGLSMLNSDTNTRVLIAGNGHVRKDRGVPIYILAKEPKANIITVGFIEVQGGKYKVDEYLPRWNREHLPFDYVWFTPAINRKNPCDDFIRKFKIKSK